MSNKGKMFTREDLPRLTQQRINNKQVSEAELKRLDAWLAAQTERNRVVALDGDIPIIAEELEERAIRRHSGVGEDHGPDTDVLVQLRNLMRLTPEQRVYVLESFEMDGALINPFSPPPEPEPVKPAKKAKK